MCVLAIGAAPSCAQTGGAEGDSASVPEVPRPAIVSAEQWGSEPDPIPESRRHEPRFLTVHHAGVLWKPQDEPVRKLRGLQSWGKRDKGWPDLPYHFLIAPDGRIFEGRSLAYEPETNTNYDVSGHVGVQVWGNFEEQRVSVEQLESLTTLLAWLSQELAIDPATIRGHRDVAAGTTCPGKDLYRYVESGRLRRWVEAMRADEAVRVEVGPELDGGPSEVIPGGTLGDEEASAAATR